MGALTVAAADRSSDKTQGMARIAVVYMKTIESHETTSRRVRAIAVVVLLLGLAGCGDDKPVFDAPVFDTAHVQAGGATTASRYVGEPYDAPAAHLGAAGREEYRAGQAIFEQVWVEAGAALAVDHSLDTARDGLGPLYNADRCASCHLRNGRGSVVGEGLFLRLSQPAAGSFRFVPDPTYGEQLQQRALPGLAIEASMRRIWTEQSETLPGDEVVTLRTPGFRISSWNWGLPGKHTAWSARLAPSLIGLGLLEAIPEKAILAEASAQAARDDGVNGTVSWVVHRRSGQLRLGRFGWKALQPTVAQQAAKALQQDLGLTNEIYPESVCTAVQQACLERSPGSDSAPLEVPAAVLSSLVYYVSYIAVPAPKNVSELDFQRGRLQFYRAGWRCACPVDQRPGCHAVSRIRTWLAPYADESICRWCIGN